MNLDLAEKADPDYAEIHVLRASFAATNTDIAVLKSAIQALSMRGLADVKRLAGLPNMFLWMQRQELREFLLDIIGSNKVGQLVDLTDAEARRSGARMAEAAAVDRPKGQINLQSFNIDSYCVGMTEAGQLVFDMGDQHAKRNTLRILDLKTGSHRDIAWAKSIGCFDVSHDGKMVAIQNSDKSTNILDLTTGRSLREFKDSKGLTIVSGRFSPDDKQYAYLSGDASVQVMDLATGSGYTLPTNKGYAVAWSSGAKMLAIASSDGWVRLWDTATRKALVSLEAPKKTIYSLAFSPDGQTLVAGGPQWHRTWVLEFSMGDVPLYRDTKETNNVFSMAFTPDSKSLVSGGNGFRPALWNIESDTQTALPEATGSLTSIAVGMGGKVAAYVGGSIIRLWDFERGAPFVIPPAP